jgi:hypothetical protein
MTNVVVSISVALSTDVWRIKAPVPLAPSASMIPAYLRAAWPVCVAVTKDRVATGFDRFDMVLLARPYADNTPPFDDLNWNQGPARVCLSRYRFGWPWGSLYFDFIGVQGAMSKQETRALVGELSTRAGLREGVPLKWWPGSNGPLPVAVLPLGSAANSAVFALVWFVAVAGPPKLRRWHRRRRGRCVACGYPIGPLPVCSECGRPVIL